MTALSRQEHVTRFRQFGTVSVLICSAVVAFVTWTSWGRGSVAALVLADAIAIACAIGLATLTIEVDSQGVRWFFTGGLFAGRVPFDEIASVSTQNVLPLGFGYRVGVNKRAWLVSGRKVLVLKLIGKDMTYMIGSDDPDAVRDAIERRRHP